MVQKEAYVDLWRSCQIGDAYIDLSIHLIDTYKVNAAPPLNPNPTPRDDVTESLPNRNWQDRRYYEPRSLKYLHQSRLKT